MIAEKESFDNVIFTDESSVALETHRKRCYRRKDEPRKLKPRPKHPVKVHVWGGISKRGATPIAIFTGIMTAVRYTEIWSQHSYHSFKKYSQMNIDFSKIMKH